MRPATCLHQLCHKSTKTNTGSDRNATRHCRPKPWGSGVLSELAFSLLASLSYSAHAFACLPCCDTEFNGLYLSQSISNCRRSCTSAITSVTDATLPQRVVAPSSSPEHSLCIADIWHSCMDLLYEKFPISASYLLIFVLLLVLLLDAVAACAAIC